MASLVRPKVVVLGTGWAGFRFIRDIDSAAYAVTVVSMRDHMLFTPLLCSTAVGTLEHRSIMEPVRPLAARKHIQFVLGEASSVDTQAKTVLVQPLASVPAMPTIPPFKLEYDKLVVAIGALPNTFGIPGVKEHAYFMKEVNDGRKVRARIHALCEAAVYPTLTAQQKAELLTVVVVGGGPTGVELASELSDYIDEDVTVDYPEIAPFFRVVLLEASGNVLSMFDASLRDYALQRLRAGRIDVRLGASVTAVTASRVLLSTGEHLPCGLVVWSTGVGPRPLVARGELATDARHTRFQTDAFLRVQPHTDVFAIGDCAATGPAALPAIAQVAEQQGRWLAAQLNAEATSTVTSPQSPDSAAADGAPASSTASPAKKHSDAFAQPFLFRSQGMLAYLGHWRGLADIVTETPAAKHASHTRLKGFAAFLIWRGGYLTKLGSWRNRLQVPFDWCKTLLFGRDVSQF